MNQLKEIPYGREIPENREACDWGMDPGSGANVVRLTSANAMSHNIYCEQPYCSPDGKRVLLHRIYDPFKSDHQLIIADLETLRLKLVEDVVAHGSVAHSAWSEWAYYQMNDGSIRRVSLVTYQRQQVLPAGSVPPAHSHLQTITSDDQLLIGWDYADRSNPVTFGINLATGERTVIYRGTDNTNPHAQAEVDRGDRCLYQLIKPDNHVAVYTRNLETGAADYLPFGQDRSAESSGHMAWITGKGKIVCAVNWNREENCHDRRHPDGNLLIAEPGSDSFSVVDAPQHGFYHVSVSKCGTYFVCDDFMDFRSDAFTSERGTPGPVRIVVGNLLTGKHLTLINDCQAYGIAGSSRYEPDPYLTTDNRYVIYNASPFGTVQVFAAEIPDSFLRSLS